MLNTIGTIFAGIGATAILTALSFVSVLLGVWLIGPMIALMAGPIIDKFVAKQS